MSLSCVAAEVVVESIVLVTESSDAGEVKTALVVDSAAVKEVLVSLKLVVHIVGEVDEIQTLPTIGGSVKVSVIDTGSTDSVGLSRWSLW